MNLKFKLKKGDDVIVITGKDKGKTGKILKMFPSKMKAIISEINKVKKIKSQIIINLEVLLTKRCQFISQIYLIMMLTQKKQLRLVIKLKIIRKLELINLLVRKFR